MQRQQNAIGAVGLTLICLLTSAHAGDPSVRVSTGVEYTSGEYGGTETIEDLYVPTTFTVDFDKIEFRLTVPYLSVTAPEGTTITDPGGDPLPGEGAMTTQSGLGDVVGSVTFFDLYSDYERGLALDLTASAKLGTADHDEGLGTGENDYTVRFEGYKFYDNATLFGAIGYRFRGEPTGVNLNDVLIASAGGAWDVSDKSQLGVAFDYRESAVSEFDDIQELSGFASRKLNDTWVFDVYVFTGLTDSSPDWGVGMGVSFTATKGRRGL